MIDIDITDLYLIRYYLFRPTGLFIIEIEIMFGTTEYSESVLIRRHSVTDGLRIWSKFSLLSPSRYFVIKNIFQSSSNPEKNR